MPRLGRETPWLDTIRVWNVLGQEVGGALARALEMELPERFGAHAWPRAEDYPMALLRAVVAEATVAGEQPLSHGARTAERVEEFLRLVAAPGRDIRLIHLLTDLDVRDVRGATVHGVRLEPVRGLQETVSIEMKEAASVIVALSVPLGSREPRTLAIADGFDARDSWSAAAELRPHLGHVTMALRLLTGATVVQALEVYGEPTMVHVGSPGAAEPEQPPDSHWRRVGVLDRSHLAGLERLARVVCDLEALPTESLPSVVLALGRFARAHRAASWQDVVVDLAIGLEAALSSDDREEVTLRVRTRAAHLLALPDDPARAIFDDVGELLDFRGKVVHGSVVPKAKWTKLFEARGLSQRFEADRLQVVVDRWRDLVRRAILARLLLGEATGGPPDPWPLNRSVPVDGELVGDPGRRRWRGLIRSRARALGVMGAWRRVEPLRDFVHDPWSDSLDH